MENMIKDLERAARLYVEKRRKHLMNRPPIRHSRVRRSLVIFLPARLLKTRLFARNSLNNAYKSRRTAVGICVLKTVERRRFSLSLVQFSFSIYRAKKYTFGNDYTPNTLPLSRPSRVYVDIPRRRVITSENISPFGFLVFFFPN